MGLKKATTRTLLQKRDAARRQRRLEVRDDTRRALRAALAELIPGMRVVVFGSLTRPGVFNDRSDIDLALENEPMGVTTWSLGGKLMDRLHRPVDIPLPQRGNPPAFRSAVSGSLRCPYLPLA